MCLCLAFLMLSRMFIPALWLPAGKGLTSWLLLVMFIVILLLSHLVSWVKCGTCLYRFLIFAVFLTFDKLTEVQCTETIATNHGTIHSLWSAPKPTQEHMVRICSMIY